MSAPEIEPLYLMGRCANGAEREKGTKVHAVPTTSNKALCGVTYGRRSAGWQVADGRHVGLDITCPRCLARLRKDGGAA